MPPLRERRTGKLPLLPRLRGNAGSWHRHNTGIPKSITIGSYVSEKARCYSYGFCIIIFRLGYSYHTSEHKESANLAHPRISFGNNGIF